MAERYYWECELQSLVPTMAELTGDEARHLTRVMRQKMGDHVTLFDGRGYEYSAVIDQVYKDRVILQILEIRDVDTEVVRKVTISVALPKGERQKWLVEKLTELGCHRLIPLQAERNVVQCSKQVIERLQRQVLEATKQCRRSRLMQVLPEMTIGECKNFVDLQNNILGEQMITCVAHPKSDGAFGQMDLFQLLSMPISRQIMVLIGPEGGFCIKEIQVASEAGFMPLDLGKSILRVETAAMMITAVLISAPAISSEITA